MTAGDIQNLAPTDPDLTCPSCSKLLRDAVLTPCCSTSFCDECVSNALLDNDMLCPECETRVKSLEKLKPDEDRRERAKKYVDDMLESGKELAEQEKKEREAEEEREKAAQEKAAAAAAEAEKVKQEVKQEEGVEVKVEEDAVEEDEKELFPVKPEEVRPAFLASLPYRPSSRESRTAIGIVLTLLIRRS
jgi:protein MPE1